MKPTRLLGLGTDANVPYVYWYTCIGSVPPAAAAETDPKRYFCFLIFLRTKTFLRGWFEWRGRLGKSSAENVEVWLVRDDQSSTTKPQSAIRILNNIGITITTFVVAVVVIVVEFFTSAHDVI